MADKNTISLEPKGFFEERQAKKSYPQRLRRVAEMYKNCLEVQGTLFKEDSAMQYLISLAEDSLSKEHHAKKEDIFDNLESRFSNLGENVLNNNQHYQQPVFNLANALQHKGLNRFAAVAYHALSEVAELTPSLRQQVRLGLIGTSGENLGLKKDEKTTGKEFVEKQLADFINEDPALTGDYDKELLNLAIDNYKTDYGRKPSSEASLFDGSYILHKISDEENPSEARIKLAKEDLGLALEGNQDLLLPIYLIETHYAVAGKSEIANVVSDVLAFHDEKTKELDFTDKLITKAREFRDLGMYDECINVCNRINVTKPNKDATYFAGTAYMHQGKTEEAIDYFKETLELAPKHSWAKRFLNRLEQSIEITEI